MTSYYWLKYRTICIIMAVLKVGLDIIVNISASTILWDWIFVIMSLETFRIDVIIFIADVIICYTSNWPINLRMRVTNWLVDQGQLSDLDFISGTHQREIIQFANKLHHCRIWSEINTCSFPSTLQK